MLVVNLDGHSLALFAGDQVYAVDNRCPHMGFPLHRGSVKEGILTCHWHHARFDLASGGTFDPWADDVTVFPTQLRGDEVWIDLSSRVDAVAHQRKRLADGLERNLSLVIAKAAIHLHHSAVPPAEAFRIGLDFGVHYRRAGWGQGLTMLTCFINRRHSFIGGPATSVITASARWPMTRKGSCVYAATFARSPVAAA
jgi:nitrite reductase/ring-hydroxylating ferredoxin subunit